jgi:hypothetical protein
VRLDPAKFTSQIDNPWWPMTPGSHWVFREGGQLDEVTVTKGLPHESYYRVL